MPANNSFRDLDVWQQSMTLVEEIYTISKRFPPDERFRLTSQIRRHQPPSKPPLRGG